jgi:hypothetical protein
VEDVIVRRRSRGRDGTEVRGVAKSKDKKKDKDKKKSKKKK